MELEKKFELTTPIAFGDEEITFLKLRKPSTKEIREIGFPYSLGANNDFKMDANACAKFLSKMSVLPMSVIDKMSATDFKDACLEVLVFFGQERKEKEVS